MKTFQLFVVAAVILTGILFGISSWFGLSLSLTEWVASDIIIGVVLYLGYLVVAASSSYKTKAGYSLNKSTVTSPIGKIMKTQSTMTAIVLITALFFVILPFGSATAGEALTVQEHVQIAKHHETLLRAAEAKLKEHQAALEDYESRSYYYGRGGQDFQSHEIANIHEYEKIVAENKAQAELHYKLVLSH